MKKVLIALTIMASISSIAGEVKVVNLGANKFIINYPRIGKLDYLGVSHIIDLKTVYYCDHGGSEYFTQIESGILVSDEYSPVIFLSPGSELRTKVIKNVGGRLREDMPADTLIVNCQSK